MLEQCYISDLPTLPGLAGFFRDFAPCPGILRIEDRVERRSSQVNSLTATWKRVKRGTPVNTRVPDEGGAFSQSASVRYG